MPALGGASRARRRAVGAAASLSLGLGSLASWGSGARGRRAFTPWLGTKAAAWAHSWPCPSRGALGQARSRRAAASSSLGTSASSSATVPRPRGDDGSVPRVDASRLRPGDLLAQTPEPVVLTNLAECWPARHCWSREYLATVHGDIPVAKLRLEAEAFARDSLGERRGNAMYADHARNVYVPFARTPEQMPLRDLILGSFDDYYFEIGETGAAGRLSIDAFGGPDGLPPLLASDDLTQLTFGMGPEGDGVMFHAHTAAWNALMYGTKEWIFFSPETFVGETYDRLAMLEARAILPALTEAVEEGAVAAPMRCIQRAGEVVYIPDAWWHATFSHAETACLGGQRHKDRLPEDWADGLLQSWPNSGLALNAAAKKNGDAKLFEAAVHQEPFNLRFVIEHLNCLQERCEWRGMRDVAIAYRARMDRARQQGLFAEVELAAVVAQLGERLYHAVEAASAAASVSVEGGPSVQMAVFQEAVLMSQTAHSMVREALELDPSSTLAKALAKAISVRAESVTRSYQSPG